MVYILIPVGAEVSREVDVVAQLVGPDVGQRLDDLRQTSEQSLCRVKHLLQTSV